MFLETSFCTPSVCKTSFLRNWMFSSESDCNKFTPLAIVLATSNANIDIVFPLKVRLVTKPLPTFKFDILLPSVSRTSTALSRPIMPALPRNELLWETYKKKINKQEARNCRVRCVKANEFKFINPTFDFMPLFFAKTGLLRDKSPI